MEFLTKGKKVLLYIKKKSVFITSQFYELYDILRPGIINIRNTL